VRRSRVGLMTARAHPGEAPSGTGLAVLAAPAQSPAM
jgi:hypothetical protein